jgi:hypothetical protein
MENLQSLLDIQPFYNSFTVFRVRELAVSFMDIVLSSILLESQGVERWQSLYGHKLVLNYFGVFRRGEIYV